MNLVKSNGTWQSSKIYPYLPWGSWLQLRENLFAGKLWICLIILQIWLWYFCALPSLLMMLRCQLIYSPFKKFPHKLTCDHIAFRIGWIFILVLSRNVLFLSYIFLYNKLKSSWNLFGDIYYSHWTLMVKLGVMILYPSLFFLSFFFSLLNAFAIFNTSCLFKVVS